MSGFVNKYCRSNRITLQPAPLNNRSFADRYIASRPEHIHKLKAKDSTGRWAYYFMLVEPPVEQRFLTALQSDKQIDLDNYGTVIASCYGESPNSKVEAELLHRFGFVL